MNIETAQVARSLMIKSYLLRRKCLHNPFKNQYSLNICVQRNTVIAVYAW